MKDTLTLGIAAALLLTVCGAAAGAVTARPTTAIAPGGCVTDTCHPGVKKHRVIHAPVNVNACEACHTLADPAKHTFVMTRAKAEMCTFCHKLDLKNATVIHKPLTTGDCLQCHSPHGSTNSRFLRGETMNDLCKKCHQDVRRGQKNVHGPVAAGACGTCHEAHAGKFPKLLVAQGRQLCLNCHKQMDTQLKAVKFAHKAADADCDVCHDPHASNYPMMTRQPPVQLCTATCHKKVKDEFGTAAFPHGAVLLEGGCLNCHTAHGGDIAKLMRTTPIKVCLTCHDKPIARKGLPPVASVAEVLNPKLIKHGPIRQGNCSGCHSPHGGPIARRLIKPFPEAFYEGFEAEKYALCFSCHNPQLVMVKTTVTATQFRNGDENLHFVHVNKARKGRSCRACHSTHASTNPMHIRESVPYGGWELPIRYQSTATGGQCAAGCHQALAYDRNKAIVYKKEGQDTSAPKLTPAPAATQPATTRSLKPQSQEKPQ